MPAWSSDASSTHINKHSLFKHVSWYKHQQAYLKCDLDVSASKGEKYIESEIKDLNVCKPHISKKTWVTKTEKQGMQSFNNW